MAHDHTAQTHNHAAGANSRMLAIALGLTTTFLIAELIGSFVFNSLALLSDAAHMFTDSAALAIALAAIKIGQKPADDARTFGYRRFEILAAAFNALLLFAVAGYVLWEGISRFFEPSEVQSTGMLTIAAMMRASNRRSKCTYVPRPGGTCSATISMIPPRVSLSMIACRISACICSA